MKSLAVLVEVPCGHSLPDLLDWFPADALNSNELQISRVLADRSKSSQAPDSPSRSSRQTEFFSDAATETLPTLSIHRHSNNSVEDLSCFGQLHLAVAGTFHLQQALPATNILCILPLDHLSSMNDVMDLLSPVEALLSSVLWIETGCSSIVFLSLNSSADAPSVIQTYMGMPSQDSRMDLQNVLILPVAHFMPTPSDKLVGLCQQLRVGPELPTCGACLRRLDEPLSELASPLSHTTPERDEPSASRSNDRCSVCFALERPDASARECSMDAEKHGLCLCLICGFCGCGRHQEGHSSRHYAETSKLHSFAIELDTQRIWDYATDCYVHLLPEPQPSSSKHSEAFDDKTKQISVQDEFVTLLSQQLESQRFFYAMQIENAQHELVHMESAFEEEARQLSVLIAETGAHLARNEKKMIQMDQAVSDYESEIKAMLAELVMLRQKRKKLVALSSAQRQASQHARDAEQEHIKQLLASIQDAKTEIHDLELHFSQAEMLRQMNVTDSPLILTQSPHKAPAKKRRSKRK